ncbi:DUF721 domain-containing protein [bacterium]|nr:DUF721 domain-containing protein [bacterium]
MAKKVLYTEFSGIDEIVSTILKESAIKKGITRSNLFKFWEKVVGEKFSNNSKPYSMTKNYVMVVACKNSTVAQELMLRKAKILKELEPYLKSLKLTVKDLHFDVKKWTYEEK